jgi:hypothetical protein
MALEALQRFIRAIEAIERSEVVGGLGLAPGGPPTGHAEHVVNPAHQAVDRRLASAAVPPISRRSLCSTATPAGVIVAPKW